MVLLSVVKNATMKKEFKLQILRRDFMNWLKRLSIISDYALILANVAFIISLRIDGLDWINIAILLLLSGNMFYIGRDFERRK